MHLLQLSHCTGTFKHAKWRRMQGERHRQLPFKFEMKERRGASWETIRKWAQRCGGSNIVKSPEGERSVVFSYSVLLRPARSCAPESTPPQAAAPATGSRRRP
eukprot:8698924-Pyramimonas_sp.AAC.1